MLHTCGLLSIAFSLMLTISACADNAPAQNDWTESFSCVPNHGKSLLRRQQGTG